MFYTYLWLRYDGTPYYAGKGKGNRAFVSDGHSVRRPKDKKFILIQLHISEEESFIAEKFLISYYGRLDLGTGCLRNRTDGGEGQSGYSEEVKKKCGNGMRGKKRPPRSKEWNERASLARIGKKNKRHKPLKEFCFRGHRRTPDNLTKSGACLLCRALKNKGTPSGARRKTHCKYGHPRTTEKPKQGCKVCRDIKRSKGRKINNPGILKPVCSRGHARTPDNVYDSGECKICAREKASKRKLRNKESLCTNQKMEISTEAHT